ncbi:MAG TPA: 2Fe-2S iron-sulfur cluster-binding protein [Solirubrobacteraceae bacterium]|nr:2Fe-2S iron-sulfur cluster-binding protein [Solirubrobacteraceae bacterium]
MAERGAVPNVSPVRRRALRLVGSFTSPLLPDDYLELVNPLWSTRELRGRIVRVQRETRDAVSVVIKPGWEWPGHRAGQYVRLGVAVDGVHHWRAYSLTSEPGRADGCIAITPKLVEGGTVSPFLNERVRPGAIVRLGGVEGTFTLPEPAPERLLFLSAGSGITPIVAMLRSLDAARALRDVVHVHCSRTADGVIFASELQRLRRAHGGYRLHMRVTGEHGRLAPRELQSICPDWRERESFLCGPAGLLATIGEQWRADGDAERLHVERFQPDARVGDGERGCGGAIRLCRSGVDASSDGEQPILAAGEAAGASMPFGCRMGICHSCVGRLRRGRVRDLRTGHVHGQPGEIVRTCVNAPEGAIEIDL